MGIETSFAPAPLWKSICNRHKNELNLEKAITARGGFFRKFSGMKLILTVLFAFFTFYGSFAQLILWEPEITVADGSVYGNARPRATLVNGNPVVIFGKMNSPQNLFIARWNGSAFDAPVPIVPSGTSSYLTEWTGPDIDSYGNTVIATFKLEPLDGGKVYSVRSSDGGVSFSDTIRVDDHPLGVAWMPSMAMDPSGNPMITYMAHDAAWANPRYVLVRSVDGGLSYGPEMEVSSNFTPEVCDCCPAELAVNDNKVALLFRNNESNVRDIYAASSNDGGASFTSVDNVDQLNWSLSSCPSTGADGCFANNRLLTAYASAASGKFRVYVSTATLDGPIGFEDRMQVPAPDLVNGTQNFPRISSVGDTVVMAWRETVFGNQEIFCALSLPGQNPLQALTAYKQQSNESMTGAQTNPEILYQDGFVHLFYQDNGSGNLKYRRGSIAASVGLEEAHAALEIYPNPNKGSFFVDAHLEEIRILDALGRSVDAQLVENGPQLQVTLLGAKSGLYLLEAVYYGQSVRKRIVLH
jgi:hypothetical protein